MSLPELEKITLLTNPIVLRNVELGVAFGGALERGSVKNVSLNVGRTRLGRRGVAGVTDLVDFLDGAGDALRLSGEPKGVFFPSGSTLLLISLAILGFGFGDILRFILDDWACTSSVIFKGLVPD